MLRPYLQLVRFPAIFSAMSNAFAGYFIGGGYAGWVALTLGVLAAALFLMGGMALNDIADIKIDRQERPSRPLPAGAIPLSHAWGVALGCFVLALFLQFLANPVAAQVGLLLVASIFLYNFGLKSTFLGPLSMALCRVLNLAAGIALNFAYLGVFGSLMISVYAVLFSLGFYVALVTWLARDEVAGNSPGRVHFFFAGLAAWFAAWAAFASTDKSLAAFFVVVILLLLVWLLKDAIVALRAKPSSPAATGRTVGGMLGAMPATDALAMLATSVAWPWALLTLLWMLPGRWLARRFYTT